MIKITVEIEQIGGGIFITPQVSPSVRVVDLIRQILQELLVHESAVSWELVYQNHPLPLDAEIGQVVSGSGVQEVTLRLRRKPAFSEEPAPSAGPQTPASAAPAPAEEDDFDLDLGASTELQDLSEVLTQGLEESDFEMALSEGATKKKDSGEVVAMEECVASLVEEDCAAEDYPAGRTVAAGSIRKKTQPGRKARQGQRRATVRYYDRMNPQRVYPFLVLLTEQMVERISKSGTDQRASGPFQVDLDSVIEVEPVLPGCICYPPKATARLDRKNLTLTFHIVPHVLGKVTGAKVLIRQDHRTLAEVELHARVVQRTTVLFCGILTFLLPFFSSLAKHFGLDFVTQREAGFSLYLTIAQTLFEGISPFALTLILGSVTGCLYWLTRPRVRDTFWDLTLVQPGTLLKQIASEWKTDPVQGAKNLVDLLKTHPDFQPGFLVYAGWEQKRENFQAALKGYEKAFQLGPAKPANYLQASLAASRLGWNAKALAILKSAILVLPSRQISGVMWFNLGCYHARLGSLDEVLPCLQKALQAGFHKVEAYLNDPDLKPIREREGFKLLVKKLQTMAN